MPSDPSSPDLIAHATGARDRIWSELRGQLVDDTYWTGELSSSALSTATAVTALTLVDADANRDAIAAGLEWLADNRNEDGGWGDTVRSRSNLSTTFLVRGAIAVAKQQEAFADARESSGRYIDDAGGTDAILAKYGKDRTFSVPILTMGALGRLCEWSQIPRLPFELAALPREFYAAVRLPVVSYALPALIAIGQLLHERNPSRVPPVRLLRNAAGERTLFKLATLQPANGGFLEATPLTSFVTMSLAAMGRASHPVAEKGTAFLLDSQRPDGAWPIDTNLSTWCTTLVVNAWGPDARKHLPNPDATLDWLLRQQYDAVHPFTGAAPGGWAWTPLPGGVPDADDTAGAIRAVCHLGDASDSKCRDAVSRGLGWLRDLQNRNGGIPTFCRGWGTLPFDESTPELTAHYLEAVRCVAAWTGDDISDRSVSRAKQFLDRSNRDGRYLPLWFGNEHHVDERNPVYGTARVLASSPSLDPRGEALVAEQNEDGGFGGSLGLPSTVEETAVAITALSSRDRDATRRAVAWLCDAIDRNAHQTATPIGLYFANLWYFESLYPLAFALDGLNTFLRDALTES